MPRYTKSGGAKGYRKKYKTVNYDDAQTVLQNLSPHEFTLLQEIARHGLGMHTMFRELLSEHPKTKVKPSSFQQYANAQNPEEVIQGLQAEKEAHDNPASETHLGGGLRDAHNAVGSWASNASNLSNMTWAHDKLDPKSLSTYREPFQDFNHEHAAGFLSMLDKKEFGHIKKVASHFGGRINHRRMPKKPSRKVKKRSWNTIADADSPHAVGRAMAKQKSDMGGGLLDGINAAISTIWHFSPFNVAYDWIKKKRGLSDIQTRMSDMQKYDADTLEEAYKKPGHRVGMTPNGWINMPKYDGEYTSVFKNPKDNSLHVAIRGSQSLKDWAFHDALIMGRNKPGKDETERIQQFLIQVAKENPDADITVNSHSLSGSFVQNAFTSATPEEDKWLDHYDVINLYNPGSNALADTSNIHEFVTDDRVHLFLNRTDVISTAYAQAITDENKERVVFGNATYNPLNAHTFSQWQSDETTQPADQTADQTDLGGQVQNDSWIDQIINTSQPTPVATEVSVPAVWISEILG